MSNRRSGSRGTAGMHAGAAGRAPDASLVPDRTLLRVAVSFVVIYVLLQVALYALTLGGYLEPATRLTAGVAGLCSNATGVAASVRGSDVVLTSRVLRIDPDCTGVTLVMIYSALILAYPLSAKHKLVGLALGVPAILAANMTRLVLVAQLSGPLGDRAFLFIHDYVFKVLMMAAVIGAWALYLSWARRHATT